MVEHAVTYPRHRAVQSGKITVDMRYINRNIGDMNNREKLLDLAERFAEARRLSISRVSTLVRNDGKFFKNLADGKDCTLGTLDHCVQWFSDRWPDNTVWPEGLERPAKSSEAA